MLLNEFFGKSIDVKKPSSDKDQDDKNTANELFWYMLDHDRLHKDYVIPLANKIKHAQKTESLNKSKFVKEFMPMVNRGCIEYYQKNKLTGKPETLFPKDLREELCEKLYDHYCDDILKDQYQLGN
jgi:hypothetical protein